MEPTSHIPLTWGALALVASLVLSSLAASSTLCWVNSWPDECDCSPVVDQHAAVYSLYAAFNRDTSGVSQTVYSLLLLDRCWCVCLLQGML